MICKKIQIQNKVSMDSNYANLTNLKNNHGNLDDNFPSNKYVSINLLVM